MTTHANRAILISGASSGIGAACALALDRAGFLVFAGVRRTEDGEALQKQASGSLVPIILDVAHEETFRSAYSIIASTISDTGLYGLVNNAGIAVGGPLELIPLEELRKQFEVNVMGQIAVTQTFLPLLRQGQGRIVMMGSVSGKAAFPFGGPYSASKFALEALTDSLRMELAPWNIGVSLIEPGCIATPIWSKSLKEADNLLSRLPTRSIDLYGPQLQRVKNALTASAKRGIPPIEVVKAVTHALTAKEPKTRYVVGRDARLRILLKVLPDKLQDWLVLRRFSRCDSLS